MILLFFLLSLFRHYDTGPAPASTSLLERPAYNATLFFREDTTDACPGRSIWDIVWSCLATTFAVTWLSVHPNMPFLEERSWSLLKRRIFLMCLALLAPEMMIMWAFKQWRGAVMIKETFNNARPASCRPWTMAHAHFVQMGGFKLRASKRRDNQNCEMFDYKTRANGVEEWEGVLTFYNFKNLLVAGKIRCPDISEAEIEDRSKSDALSKGVALLQISWFIIQLIARAHQRLGITEIELTTAALAGLNSIMYLFWWNKPFDVRCPVIIRTKRLERRFTDVGVDWGAGGGESLHEEWSFPIIQEFKLKTHLMTTMEACMRRVLIGIRTAINSLVFNWSKDVIRAVGCKSPPVGSSPVPDPIAQGSAVRRGFAWIWASCATLVAFPLYVPYLITFLPMDKILDPFAYGAISGPYADAKEKTDNAPSLQLFFRELDMAWIMAMMFYSERADAKPQLVFSALTGAAFGSIHCAAWNFRFPTVVEKIMWRTASLTIVGVCLCIVAAIPLYNYIWKQAWKEGRSLEPSKFWKTAKKIIESVPVVVYPIARLSLLILSLLSLRDLSPSALETVVWTKFIPHI